MTLAALTHPARIGIATLCDLTITVPAVFYRCWSVPRAMLFTVFLIGTAPPR